MTNAVCAYLHDKIRAFIEARNQSIRWLSRQSGVDYSTVYRLHEGEQKSLAFYPAYQLLKLLEPETYMTVLGEYYPDETRDRLANSQKLEDQSQLFKTVVSDIVNHAVFQHIALVPKASRETVAHEYGQLGLQAVNKLIDAGVIQELENGTFTNKLDGTLLLNEEECKAYATTNIALLSLRNPGTHIYGISHGLNESGLKECYAATAKCIVREHTPDFLPERN
jgi:hypothetical protein